MTMKAHAMPKLTALTALGVAVLIVSAIALGAWVSRRAWSGSERFSQTANTRTNANATTTPAVRAAPQSVVTSPKTSAAVQKMMAYADERRRALATK